MLNWQLGQYIELAVGDIIAGAFGKNVSNYPKEPAFSKNLVNDKEEKSLSKAQQELETLKFKEFFSHLGNYVKIKGGKNGK